MSSNVNRSDRLLHEQDRLASGVSRCVHPVPNHTLPHNTNTSHITSSPTCTRLTHTGESLKKAVKEGRYDASSSPLRRPKGQTRGQIRLVPLLPPNDIDLRSVGVLVISAAYCFLLRPRVLDGSLASSAVLGFLNKNEILEKILGNMKTKFERLANRKHLMKCAGVLHAWVREGSDADKKIKLELFRNLGGDFQSDMSQHMAYRIVQTLLTVSKGRDAGEDNKRGYYPYTKKASYSTKVFKSSPSSWFATSLTVLYPFIVRDKDKWPGLLKKYLHPMTATGLWPVAVINRYLSFFSLFRANRDQLFACYESQKGDYHGPESGPTLVTNVITDLATLSSEESEDSVDADFV